MWPLGILLLIFAQAVQAQSCNDSQTSSGTPPTATPPTGAPPTSTAPHDVFTTSDGIRFRVETVATSLQIPWSLNFAPDGRLFVTERAGRVRIFNAALTSSSTALTVDDTFAEGEAGVLGLALDPDFSQSRFVYIYYTARAAGSPVNRVVRYREVGGQLAERAVLLDGIPAATIHDGGRLRFGPDGLLYITAGDANTPARAQDVAVLSGKILRINRDGTTPRGNPFGSPVFSIGHRNPQGLDWSPSGTVLWSDEHGQIGNDEINVVDSGADYGWPAIEGSESRTGMRTPLTSYSPSVAPSGGSFYRGSRFRGFADDLFVATLRGEHLIRIRQDATGRRIGGQERLLDGRFGRLRDVIMGPDELLYFCTNNRDGRGTPEAGDDRILRLVPAS